MIFHETTSGGATLAGQAAADRLRPVRTTFGVGDTVYVAAKAKRGGLEKVVVKEVRSVISRRTHGSNRVLYRDTLNGLWNEGDLVPYQSALELIADYGTEVENARSRLRRS